MKWRLQAENIKELRRKNSITQEELAALVYSKPQQVSSWERGEYPVPASRLSHLTRALNDENGSIVAGMTRDYQNILLSNALSKMGEK